MKLPLKNIEVKTLELTTHPLLSTNVIQTQQDLRIFMEHHVFPVWDFMSLAKALQHRICPSGDVWLPTGGGSISHFDLYLQAMAEVGANTKPILRFIDNVEQQGIDYAIENTKGIPDCTRDFMRTTFDFIATGKKHVIASAFTYGREAVIPGMFQGILQQLNINSYEAKKFHYYLQRHIELDGDEHGPMATKLVENLCGEDPLAYVEAETVAIEAMNARIKFWDQVEKELFE